MKIIKNILLFSLAVLLTAVTVVGLLSRKADPDRIFYGVTFSKPYAEYLGISPRETFISILDDLQVRKFRLVAYWSEVESQKGVYRFDDLDFQIREAEKRGAEVVLSIGRRLPRWPECHIPSWAAKESWDEQKKDILLYLTKTVEHYKNSSAIKYWQVENEPYLFVYAKENCGDVDREFIAEEVALVKKLDGKRPVMVTDSGNLGLWFPAWRVGDVFGTSVYMYLWNPQLGEIRSFYQPYFYKAKANLMNLFFGGKKSVLIELSLEPWLLEPIISVPLQTQIDRMDISKFHEVLEFARGTGFDEQYLWGVEWWYYMKQHGHPEYLDEARKIFQ